MCGIREISVGSGQDMRKISSGWRSGKIRLGVVWVNNRVPSG
jgi:hypothetical protein